MKKFSIKKIKDEKSYKNLDGAFDDTMLQIVDYISTNKTISKEEATDYMLEKISDEQFYKLAYDFVDLDEFFPKVYKDIYKAMLEEVENYLKEN